MAKDFLLEIGTEEIPARFINPALKQFKELAEKAFEEHRLKYEEIKTYGTPRRLVLYVKQLDEQQAELTKEAKGPAKKVAFDEEGNPTKAAMGFARSQGVNVEDLVVKTVGRVEYMYAIVKEEGHPTEKVLADLAPQLISGLRFPKPMRWGNLDYRFARPIHWVVALFGADVVPFTVANLASNRFTYGHRFLSDGPLKVNDAVHYFEVMSEGYVMVDGEERRRVIWQQVQDLAGSVGGRVEFDEELLDEITNIVEYPTALMGSFAEHYLNMPSEVIITPMREHQRYFPVLDADGKLLPRFIAVRNGTEKHLDIVTAGNEKVLAARLADAEFFYKEDLKVSLSDKVDELKKVVWLEELGTMYEKVQRIAKLADSLAVKLGVDQEQRDKLARAAYLAKADLVTNMVYEFPELQGIMGREYALKNGEDSEVARAIYEHYLPRYAGDDLPAGITGQLLSLADKLDSIVGCFAIGIQPTGSQDPYALRRQALGITYILLDADLPLSLREMISLAYSGYQDKEKLKLNAGEVVKEVQEFFKQRIKGVFSERGFSYDTIDAVLEAGFDVIADTWNRGRALSEFRRRPAFDDLLTAFNRVNNLAKKSPGGTVDEKLLQEQPEKELYRAYVNFKNNMVLYMKNKDYVAVFNEIALLLEPINKFFEQIMVMVDDEQVRNNRLALLYNLAEKMKSIADFSKVVA
ncbi:glycyl-tRNA synthetase beta chain [Desulfohalotomaculum tongense]|uniref:glycine--tRNA ligase subunit beta n=1 Tax=Desulforadius tongensis TaxID=1216062 RepID=UPI001956DF6A|nr:glycine--tRNA ligase subunit beta [Desulforadius tongensis]MBM7855792.1 glycyl-tRNA synthetase beta chain [Desulforadius tongensis]